MIDEGLSTQGSCSRLKAWLEWQLRVLAIVTFLLVLCVILMAILKAAGDMSAASALRGLVWLAVAGLSVDLVALLVTTAFAVMKLLDTECGSPDEERPASLGD